MATEIRLSALIQRARIGQFASVGAVGAVIETAIIAFLTTISGTDPLTAKAVGAEVSITTMFAINDRWTFAEEGDIGIAALFQRWGKSHLVRVIGLGISFSVLYFLTNNTRFTLEVINIDLWPTVANVAGITIGMIVNYIAESLFTWNIT